MNAEPTANPYILLITFNNSDTKVQSFKLGTFTLFQEKVASFTHFPKHCDSYS